jgi:hypothetical protein
VFFKSLGDMALEKKTKKKRKVKGSCNMVYKANSKGK